ncbi:membrane protein [Microbacterium phage OscarSo]|uniref:Membrane protein n=1 Tax=Microbacterium phage OscarSo TaxID=2985324 RepID=A0A9X9K4C1_9CAUD|nr:membrane protein [Microbacterium phage OscarSo]UYL87128.1 membrane protein [Microbacterium phage OscarSo]
MNIDKKRIGAVATAVIAVGILAGGSIAFAANVGSAAPADEPDRSTISRVVETPEPTVTPTETPTPEPVVTEEPAPAEPAPVVEQPAAPAPAPAPAQPAPAPEPPAPAPAPEPPAPYVPVKCPAGTIPGQVDANGDESLCQAPCQEWIDTDGDGYAETCGRP